jgi:ketosteroid isomerase-like protein
MQVFRTIAGFSLGLLMCISAHAAPATSNAELKKQVFEVERAFAATMKQRDHAAFVRHLADEAVFFSGPTALTGKETVAKQWKVYYEGKDAPFSWEPDSVEVLASGTLAISSGPVYDPSGKVVSRFNSIWRQDAPGVWHVVFDKGSPVCNCKPQ